MDSKFTPWYNIPLINFLKSHLKQKHNVFEYGGGHSTLFYSEKVNFVCTIETKQEWVDFVNQNKTKDNIDIKLPSSMRNFANEIENFNIKKFDLIIVDSRDRAMALIKSVDYLNQNGIIVLDNSERDNLQSAILKMEMLGFKKRVFSGLRLDGKISIASVFFQSDAS